MKLKNKKTGEIIKVESLDVDSPTEGIVGIPSFDRKGSYTSLAELNEEWEDYEEPKEYWAIDQFGEPINVTGLSRFQLEKLRQYGNDFETKEEAEKAVEKLKAWKRLKDKGFRFNRRYKPNYGEIFVIECRLPKETLIVDVVEDLDLLFGGEE